MPLPRNVKSLGLVSFFTDIASEMLYPIIPLFIVGTLGASPAILGVIEGLADGLASSLKWVGGKLSDRTGKRKPFVIVGYSLSALSKPIMGLAAVVAGPAAWGIFLTGRISDRIGKAVRTAPRDALIADSVPKEQRGAAFGFHRAMDTCGAIVGPLITLIVINRFPDLPLHYLFFVAVIPGAVSVLVAWKYVTEIRVAPKSEKSQAVKHSYTARFWWIVIAFAIFSLGNSSDSFLLLRARELGLSFSQVIFAYSLYNLVGALLAWPLGQLSDRIGRVPLIVTGWLIYALVYSIFAFNQTSLVVWLSMCGYGVYAALTEGVIKAMVSDHIESAHRASALGIVAGIGGVCQVIASIVTGLLWPQKVIDGQFSLAFLVGAGCAGIAVLVILGSTLAAKKTVSS